MEDYYAPWEWIPVDLMPDGCNEVIVRYDDGSTRPMCSCDYWWTLKDQTDKVATDFRYED